MKTQEIYRMIISQACSRGLDLMPDYESWLRGCFAIAGYEHGSLADFDALCQQYPKYDAEAVRKKWEECRRTGNGTVKIETLFHLAQQAGIELTKKSQRLSKNEPTTQTLADESVDDVYITPFLDLANMPPILGKSLEIAATPAVKDMLLLSNLTAVSYAIPSFITYHGNPRRTYHANLMTLLLAPAASGKGITYYSKRLLDPIHNDMKEMYRLEKADYDDAVNGGDKTAQAPVRKLVFMPANSSMPVILQQLHQNGGRGMLMATEMDTLSQIWGQDYGQYSDVLRCAFEHETVSQRRRREDEYIEIERPEMSVLLSGTYNQLQPLLKSRENGLYSRFCPLVVTDTLPFDESVFDADDDNETNLRTYNIYKEAGFRIRQLWLWQNSAQNQGRTCLFRLTDSQRMMIKRLFVSQYKGLVAALGTQLDPTIKRMAVIAKRIGMCLTALRMEPQGNLPGEVWCSDEDFRTICLIVSKLLLHAARVAQMLPKSEEHALSESSPMQHIQLMSMLSEEFTTADAKMFAKMLGISERTIDAWLLSGVKNNKLMHLRRGTYKKI